MLVLLMFGFQLVAGVGTRKCAGYGYQAIFMAKFVASPSTDCATK